MGRYVSIRGWLDCNSENIPQIKEIVNYYSKNYTNYSITQEARTIYNKGWRYPDDDMWQYVFYGANIRSYYAEYIKLQVEAIAAIDPDIEGKFFIDEEEGKENYIWEISNGKLQEIKQQE